MRVSSLIDSIWKIFLLFHDVKTLVNFCHTAISSKLNDVMKFLTIFSVFFIPLTFIAGIYGTNFDVVPELKYEYSYFIMWGVMIFVTIGMLKYFKNTKVALNVIFWLG